jgi:hypothetical protein
MQQKIADHVDHDAVKQLQILEYMAAQTAVQHTQGHHNGSAGGDGTAGTCIAFAFVYFTHLLPLPSVSLVLFQIGVVGLCAQLPLVNSSSRV